MIGIYHVSRFHSDEETLFSTISKLSFEDIPIRSSPSGYSGEDARAISGYIWKLKSPGLLNIS
jgi:hypothetical protein